MLCQNHKNETKMCNLKTSGILTIAYVLDNTIGRLSPSYQSILQTTATWTSAQLWWKKHTCPTEPSSFI